MNKINDKELDHAYVEVMKNITGCLENEDDRSMKSYEFIINDCVNFQ